METYNYDNFSESARDFIERDSFFEQDGFGSLTDEMEYHSMMQNDGYGDYDYDY